MKIFISSTCYDLIDIRAEINSLLKKTGLNPIMSDQTNSDFNIKTNTNSIETCLVNLRNSDLVVIILSKRYGPKLGKVGFEDISATHLEYKEALKENKPILFYVRDRLEADFNLYRKTKDASKLNWVGEKDLGLFDIIQEHSKLTNNDKNNWYYSFRTSLDLKERLKIDLENDITKIRLQNLIESGKTPYLLNQHEILTQTSSNLLIQFIVNNIGREPAIDPVVAFTKANSYQEILENSYYDDILNYKIITLDFLKTNDQTIFQQNVKTPKEEDIYFIEIFYKTLSGEVLSDVTRMYIEKNKMDPNQIDIKLSYEAKRFISTESYKKISNI